PGSPPTRSVDGEHMKFVRAESSLQRRTISHLNHIRCFSDLPKTVSVSCRFADVDLARCTGGSRIGFPSRVDFSKRSYGDLRYFHHRKIRRCGADFIHHYRPAPSTSFVLTPDVFNSESRN